jgi:hypothetical protein
MKKGATKKINDKLAHLELLSLNLTNSICELMLNMEKLLKDEPISEDDILIEPALPVKVGRGRPKKIVTTCIPDDPVTLEEIVNIGRKSSKKVSQL